MDCYVTVSVPRDKLREMLKLPKEGKLEVLNSPPEQFVSQVYDKQTLMQPIQSALNKGAATGLVINSFFLVNYPPTRQFVWVPADACILTLRE